MKTIVFSSACVLPDGATSSRGQSISLTDEVADNLIKSGRAFLANTANANSVLVEVSLEAEWLAAHPNESWSSRVGEIATTSAASIVDEAVARLRQQDSSRVLASLAAFLGLAADTTGNTPAMSYDMNVLGDSTGAAQNYWPGLLAAALAARCPDWAVKYRPFSWANQQFGDWVDIADGTSGARTLSIGNGGAPQGLVCAPNQSVEVTGDLWAQITYKLNNTVTGSFGYIVGQAGSGNKWEWGRQLGGNPYLMLTYDGQNWAVATAAPQPDSDGFIHLAVTVKVNSGNFVTKYWHRLAGVWTQLGDTLTTTVSGFTAIGSGVENYYLGGVSDSLLMPANTEIREATWGKADASKAFPAAISSFEGPPKLESWVQPVTGIATMSGSPEIRVWNGSISGADLANTINPRVGILTPINADLTIISCSHNNGPQDPATFMGYMEACLTAVKARTPRGDLAVCTQNPQLIEFEATAGYHAQRRMACIGAARSLGYAVIDTMGDFLSRPDWQLSAAQGGLMQPENSDGKHPSSSGQSFWCEKLLDRVTDVQS